ncbi:MAG: tetratricopeptide repeat protein [Methanomicrobiales archaeon]|jgi:type III secretion system low calcium response chaperone LcrH/SycD
METAAARYLEFMVNDYYNRLMALLDLEDLSDEDLETLYALGYNFFTYGKYQAAKDIFVRLTAIAPYTAFYWRALGAVNQQMKNYAEAIAAYNMAIANDEADIVSYVYRGESQILSGNIEAALKDFEKVLKIGANDSQTEPWVKRAHLLINIHKQS